MYINVQGGENDSWNDAYNQNFALWKQEKWAGCAAETEP